MSAQLVCILCGRVGSRGFVITSGTGDGTRDSYCCENRRACERRQAANPLPGSERDRRTT